MTSPSGPGRPARPSWTPAARAVALVAALATVGGLGTALAAAVDRPGDGTGPVGRSLPEGAGPPSAVGPSSAPLFRPSRLAEGEDDAGGGPQRAPRAAGSVGGTGAAPSAAGDEPVEVRLPTIGVRSVLVPLGLEPDGTMEVPTDFGRAGWLTTAPVPGARGPAVIAGHVDSTTGPAVFFRLGELADGDPVEVRQRDGDVVRFTVRSRATFAKDRFPTEQVYGPTAGPVLRLITCDGDIDPRTGHYTDNLVVFAS